MKWNRRCTIVVLLASLAPMSMASAQVSIGVGVRLPGVSIGINLPSYPELRVVPGYPVYYAPRLDSNYFFYDGMYWVYQGDDWYASSWYNGPWDRIAPEAVPAFVLQIPVSYYRRPPAYFRGWLGNQAPRWGEHWGPAWEQRRSGWNRPDRRAAPAPLPAYQRKYTAERYPQPQQQQALHGQNYRYQPKESVVREHYQRSTVPVPPAAAERGNPRQAQEQIRQQEQVRQQDQGRQQEHGRQPGQGQEQGRDKGEDRHQERGR